MKKFIGTLRICSGLMMARTFGDYVVSGWNGQNHYAQYVWRRHVYFIPTDAIEPYRAYTKIRFGFRGKREAALFRLWREYWDGGDVIFAETILILRGHRS